MKRVLFGVPALSAVSPALGGTIAGIAAMLAIGIWLAPASAALDNVLVAALENSFSRPDIGDAATITGVIALGGGEARIREAGRLARKYPHLRVFISGAGEESYILGFLGEGIDPARVLNENQSRNTHQNAVVSTAIIKPKPGERWLLVTSASHMPRAVGAFRRNAFVVEPWPIYDLEGYTQSSPSVAWHEWTGLVAYWLLGRTSALFPLPDDALRPLVVKRR